MATPSTPRTAFGPVCALALVALLLALPAGAGSTGTANLYMPQGGGAAKANGDFVSSEDASNGTTGLNTYYSYWIEVPSGLTRLHVQIYDADTGTAPETTTGAEGRDRRRGTTFNTAAIYTLIRPDGTTANTLTCNAGACAGDTAAWVDLYNTTATPIPNGHWQLRVNTSGSAGEDLDGIGIRADDGDATAGGTELNVYFDSLNSFGVHSAETAGITKTYTVYPWVTAGCTFVENDFDYDVGNGTGSGAGGTYGSMSFTSRDGLVTRTIPSASLSADDTWKQNTVAQWGTDSDSTNYGVWNAQVAISRYTTPAANGNYTTVWFANPSATNPPTANPATNSFRTYLPQDGGGAPIKPYLEQMVRYGRTLTCNGAANGPNPPAVNTTTCFTVTVRFVNPSGAGTGSITFSAANLVTANVPGAGVTYDGSGQTQVSQGGVTAQPAAGGTGNITWNPGTVPAGTTALLSYVVRVRPTANGQRLPVTAAYGANGTRATFVDHTGNTTQARATITLGPICGLAVTQGTLTEALISSVRAYPEGGTTMVEWETASEAGTMGFVLERFDRSTGAWTPIVDGVLPALIEAPQGGRYRLADPMASPRDTSLRYRIVEVRADGSRLPYGPYDLTVEPAPAAGTDETAARTDEAAGQVSPVGVGDYARVAHAAQRGAEPAAAPTLGTLTAMATTASSSNAGVRLGVSESGLQYVSSAALAPLLGDTADNVAKLVAGGKLALTRQGTPVWWLPAPAAQGRSAGLYFYGQAIHDLYSTDEAYRLQRLPGTTVAATRVSGAAGGAQPTFTDTVHAEKDAFPATALSLDPASDYWFWEFFIAGDATYGSGTVAFDAPGVAGTGGATLKVHLQGATSSGVTGEHHAVVTLNGTIVGGDQWTGIAGHDITVPVAPATLLAAGNQLKVDAVLGAGVPQSVFYLDYAEVTYPRAFAAQGDALTFKAGARTLVSVAGLSGSNVLLLDVGTPQRPIQLVGATAVQDGSAFTVTFQAQRTSTYLAVGPQGLKSPTMRPWLDAGLRTTGNGAQYVVVTTSALAGAAQRLADQRQRQGLRSQVVDVEAVMDEFAYGRSNPKAIRDFLAFAAKSWHPAPRYVLLAGAGSVDYRNLLGYGDCLVPTIMVATPTGLFGADNCLADVAGGDCLPELAIGRVPALSAQDLNAYADKAIAYDADDGGWAGAFTALADAQSQSTSFAADSDVLLTHVGAGWAPQRLYLDAVPLAQARSSLFGAVRAGTSFVNYLGHGGLDRLSAGGLLTSGDVAGLDNGSRLPVLTAMTCTVNRFTVPGVASLGERLVNQPGGGAAAVWSPSALSIHAEAGTLAAMFYDAISGGKTPRLGDAVLLALTRFSQSGGNSAMLPIYALLGDPALRWKPAPQVNPPSGPSSGSLE